MDSIKRCILAILCLMSLTHLVFSQEDSLTVMVAGDMMIGSWGLEEIERNGMAYPTMRLQALLGPNDLNLCNLEAPFTKSNDKFSDDKSYSFKVPPEVAKILKLLPIHYVTLANNHIMDYGWQGLEDTIQALDRQQVAYSGAGQNISEAMKPAILQRKGLKIGIIAAGAIFPKAFWASESSPGIFFPWEDKLVQVIKSTRLQVDYLFVTFHWGTEKRSTPKRYQKNLGRLCVKHGADLVWGHHPHVIQGIEIYQGKPIIYSLGNFIFASFSKTATGMAVKMTFKDKCLLGMQVIPLNVNNFDIPIQPSVYVGVQKTKFINKVNSLSDFSDIHFDSDGKWMAGVD